MGKIFRITVLLGILSLAINACSTDNDSNLATRYWNWGRVEIAEEGETGDAQLNIRLDDGSLLIIENGQNIKNLEDGDRIRLRHTVLREAEPEEDGYKRFIAVLNYYDKVLSKAPVLQSFIDEDYEHRQDSIGSDPIRAEAVGFGGRYLNVLFTVARRVNSNELHFINLVADDVTSDGVLNVYLRHNGYKDVPEEGARNFIYATSLVSFDMLGLVPEGKKGIEVRLHWTEYNGTGWSQVRERSWNMGTFIPYAAVDNNLDSDNYDAGANVK